MTGGILGARILGCLVCAGGMAMIAEAAGPTEPWPGIGCWFWTAEEFEPDGFKRFIDLHAKHADFELLTTSIRHPVEVSDPKVHDQIKAAAEYARARGMALVMDLDVRLARQAFLDRYPDEMQELLRLQEVPLESEGEVEVEVTPLELGDHYTFRARPYESLSGRVVRVYAYRSGPDGIAAGTVEDITDRCRVVEASSARIRVAIPCADSDRGRTACLMGAFRLFTPDVFSPHLVEFERELVRSYGDAPLAGACKDEWGFPGRFEPSTDDLWFSPFFAAAYEQRRPGRDLVRDALLMARGEAGRAAERAAAVNHYMEMCWQRNGAIEAGFYDSVKEVFGPEAVAATHPTWFPYPDKREVFKNGLHWWASKRDLAQTDEYTPYSVRNALAKKWNSPVWYNMFYDPDPAVYEREVWRHALGGGRINFHPLWPHDWDTLTTSLLSSRALEADGRVRLLNHISTAPLDCPVAVVFGHPAALNWTGDGFADAGLAVADALWERGYYADLIPSSEIVGGALRIADDGRVAYGPQRYTAVVLYHPEYERPEAAEFFRRAAESGATALLRVGEWTRGFDGEPFDASSVLPDSMELCGADQVVDRVVEELGERGIEPQTPASVPRELGHGFPPSAQPALSGRIRLLDGTVVRIAAEDDAGGDPIRETMTVGAHEVRFEAVGVAAVRLDAAGQVAALAGGKLTRFEGPGLSLVLEEGMDLALWRTDDGSWKGVLRGTDTAVPPALERITADWTRLPVPAPMQ